MTFIFTILRRLGKNKESTVFVVLITLFSELIQLWFYLLRESLWVEFSTLELFMLITMQRFNCTRLLHFAYIIFQGGKKLLELRKKNIKLTYFNIEARGEFIRLMLALAAVPYEDKRIPVASEEWKQLKPSMQLFSSYQYKCIESLQ